MANRDGLLDVADKFWRAIASCVIGSVGVVGVSLDDAEVVADCAGAGGEAIIGREIGEVTGGAMGI